MQVLKLERTKKTKQIYIPPPQQRTRVFPSTFTNSPACSRVRTFQPPDKVRVDPSEQGGFTTPYSTDQILHHFPTQLVTASVTLRPIVACTIYQGPWMIPSSRLSETQLRLC